MPSKNAIKKHAIKKCNPETCNLWLGMKDTGAKSVRTHEAESLQILLHSNLFACWACWREEEEEEECLVSKSINSTTQTLYSSPERKLVGWIWVQRNLNLKILSALGCLLSESFWNWFSTLQIYKLWYFVQDPKDPTHDLNTHSSRVKSQWSPMLNNFSQNHLHFSKFPKIKHGFFICQGIFLGTLRKSNGNKLVTLWWGHGFPFVFHK